MGTRPIVLTAAAQHPPEASRLRLGWTPRALCAFQVALRQAKPVLLHARVLRAEERPGRYRGLIWVNYLEKRYRAHGLRLLDLVVLEQVHPLQGLRHKLRPKSRRRLPRKPLRRLRLLWAEERAPAPAVLQPFVHQPRLGVIGEATKARTLRGFHLPRGSHSRDLARRGEWRQSPRGEVGAVVVIHLAMRSVLQLGRTHRPGGATRAPSTETGRLHDGLVALTVEVTPGPTQRISTLPPTTLERLRLVGTLGQSQRTLLGRLLAHDHGCKETAMGTATAPHAQGLLGGEAGRPSRATRGRRFQHEAQAFARVSAQEQNRVPRVPKRGRAALSTLLATARGIRDKSPRRCFAL